MSRCKLSSRRSVAEDLIDGIDEALDGRIYLAPAVPRGARRRGKPGGGPGAPARFGHSSRIKLPIGSPRN